MKPNRAIQLKAIFLLVVFSLNTLIGFACAAGMNMGFNKKHHHHNDPVSSATVSHHHETTHHHHHDEALTKKNATEDNNCCTDKASQLSGSDKLLAQTINTGSETPVALVFLHFLYSSDLSSLFTQNIKKVPVVRPFVLNSRGIRVSIQSFQI
jgi:ABC-type nickel/cobalt efflux system permease component RcnA